MPDQAPATPVADAEQALCDAIIKAAPHASPEGLKWMGEAVADLKWGPRGGTYSDQTSYRYDTDYHYTEHDRDRSPRATGFGSDD